MPTLALLVPAEERPHRFFLSIGHQQAEASIDSISSRRCSAARGARSARLRASKLIRVRSESPSRSMASRDERPGVQLRLPLQPGLVPSGRVRERLDLPVSVRCRERGVSGVAHLPRPQDLESADSTKVVTCAVFALPPSDFPPQRPRRSSEDVVIPFPLPMLAKHCSKFNKVCFNGVTTVHWRNLTS